MKEKRGERDSSKKGNNEADLLKETVYGIQYGRDRAAGARNILNRMLENNIGSR